MSTHRLKGFTIVELLIVIVVIAVLASVTVVAYNGIQTRAKNTAIISRANQWYKLLKLYKEEKGSYPSSSYFCLGNAQK